MRAAFFLIIGLLLASLSWGAAPAFAQRVPGVLPLDRILPEIRRTHPGQFYDADGPSAGPNNSQHYHLKWMTPDGRIEWLDADARTGRVLRSAPGRDSFDPPAAPMLPIAPVVPGYGERFRGVDNGYDGNDRNDRNDRNYRNDRGDRGPVYYPRDGRDYGNGREDRNYGPRRNGNDGDRNDRRPGRFRER